MHTDFGAIPLVASLSLREARGCQMQAEKRILPAFGAYVQAQEHSSPIRAQMALEWACQASTPRGPSGAARRLSMARGFLRYLQASAPDTEVPAPGLLPSPRRPQPSLFIPTQITTLCQAAHARRPRGAWRPHTFSSVLGLLASPGLRVGAARRLQLHPRTAERRRHSPAQRARLHSEGFSEAFCVSAQGQPLQHRALPDGVARRCQRVARAPTAGGRKPCRRSLRHPFAGTRMPRWSPQGLDVPAFLPPWRSPSVTSTRRRGLGLSRRCQNS